MNPSTPLPSETGTGTCHVDPKPTWLVATYTKKTVRPISQLRPGDWLENGDGARVVVTINSAKRERICVWWEGQEQSLSHQQLGMARYTLIGHGKRRWWVRIIPKPLRRFVSEFNPSNP